MLGILMVRVATATRRLACHGLKFHASILSARTYSQWGCLTAESMHASALVICRVNRVLLDARAYGVAGMLKGGRELTLTHRSSAGSCLQNEEASHFRKVEYSEPRA